MLFINNKFNSISKAPVFVKNFDFKKGEGLFRCSYKYGQGDYQEAYTVRHASLPSFGGVQNYYSVDKKILFSSNWIDYPGLSLDGIETDCINTIFNEDGTSIQEICDESLLDYNCDIEPIYTSK